MASAAEKISFTCPHCAKVLVATARPAADAKVKCPACGHAFVPEIEDVETLATGVKTKSAPKADPDEAPRSKKSRDDDEDDDRPRRKKKSRSADDDEEDDNRPRRKKKSRAAEDDDDDPQPPRKRRRYEDDDDLPIKKKKRKAGSSNMMLIVLLIVGGGVLLVSFALCGVGAFVWPGFLLSKQGGVVKKDGGVQTYTVVNLGEDRWEDRTFNFQQGKRVTITMVSNTTMRQTDVDLIVFRGNFGEDVIAEDITIGPNGRVTFVVPNTGAYRIRVDNLGPGMVRSSTVTITEE